MESVTNNTKIDDYNQPEIGNWKALNSNLSDLQQTLFLTPTLAPINITYQVIYGTLPLG